MVTLLTFKQSDIQCISTYQYSKSVPEKKPQSLAALSVFVLLEKTPTVDGQNPAAPG